MSAFPCENWETAKIDTIAELRASIVRAIAVASSTLKPVATAVCRFAPLRVINRPMRVFFIKNQPTSAQRIKNQLWLGTPRGRMAPIHIAASLCTRIFPFPLIRAAKPANTAPKAIVVMIGFLMTVMA